ncbi:MAG: DUF1839 family protein [Gammaproteobacteria bacterium]|nr:MAG: DUF1839 family protein [Gammaproteobacteria bacterium]
MCAASCGLDRTDPVSSVSVLARLDPTTYGRHRLHTEGCVWVEKNCYVDIWIEVIHALGLEPRAVLPFTAAIDFEGDQWTFFKPPHDELRELYGLDVQEMNVWRPLIEHALEHLGAGRLISTEADAFWLPDTSGTDYRRQHTKSTIVLNDLDLEKRRLGYFHNAGYYSLEGEDFARTFRLDTPPDPTFMPLFAELVRIDALVRRPASELLALSRSLWRRHLKRRPASNPVRRFQARFERDLPGIQERGLAYYHAWAFGTIRQLGAAFELAAANLEWLTAEGVAGLAPATLAFEQLSAANKTLILKGARATNSRRPLDGAALFEEMAGAWERGMQAMEPLL